MAKNKASNNDLDSTVESKISEIMDGLQINRDIPLGQYDLVSLISELNGTPRSNVVKFLNTLNQLCQYQLLEQGCFNIEGLASFKLVPLRARKADTKLAADGSVTRIRPLAADTAIRVVSALQLRKITPKRIVS
ncbi:hypothetical protein OCF84_20625 (plasmid) [Shewanella xiamenensis]|uniref:DNA-binding protein n=1 Tax=Shewanella xiamenensis TaxID=332186 RepID=A0ABT6UFS9_9GAMM|nr:hypothetical protein [Shewanella xiamenensis]MDI5833325.1 hypothetical protein [Shewanella xiamenensis]WHF57923.1 hypothetical protein OCF84_20625 [Shewanella xiamenensis]